MKNIDVSYLLRLKSGTHDRKKYDFYMHLMTELIEGRSNEIFNLIK